MPSLLIFVFGVNDAIKQKYSTKSTYFHLIWEQMARQEMELFQLGCLI